MPAAIGAGCNISPTIDLGKEMHQICKDCGTVDDPKRFTKGSIFIEIILWICFLIPGLIYSIWRLTSRYDGCPVCGSQNIVPISTPIGTKLASEVGYSAQAPHRGYSSAEKFGRALGRLVAKRK